MKTPQPARAAFTLIELLAVMAVAGILAGLLAPAAGNARRRARSTACLGNLRQIGLLLQGHTDDSRGRLPALFNRADRGEPGPALDTLIVAGEGSAEIYRCPADTRRVFEVSGNSYTWNTLANNQRPGGIEILGQRLDPGRIPLVADKEGWHVDVEDRINILYADGHASMGLRDYLGR